MSKARADAELRAAQQRVLTEARGRRRLRWLAAGLAAVLGVATVTAVLAVRSEQAADRATAVAEDTSLIADANRLAALSGTAESLDLTYLLAAQGFRLRDTPETRDALLASLVEHRRVIRTETTDGEGPRGSLTDGGRTVFLGDHFTGGRILSWPVDSEDPPRVVFERDEDWSGWRVTTGSPTDPVVLTAGTGDSGPWVRTVDADGAVREVLGGAEVGGEPISAVVLPDGRRARLLVAGTDGDRRRRGGSSMSTSSTGAGGRSPTWGPRPDRRTNSRLSCPPTARPPSWSTTRATPPRSPTCRPVGSSRSRTRRSTRRRTSRSAHSPPERPSSAATAP